MEMVIPIFAIVIALGLIPGFFTWLGHRKEMMELEIKATAEKAAQYAASNKALEDRVAVLERIVTDKGYDVATQIEALRDQRRVDDLVERHESERSN